MRSGSIAAPREPGLRLRRCRDGHAPAGRRSSPGPKPQSTTEFLIHLTTARTGTAPVWGEGKLIGSRRGNLFRTDLRDVVSREDVAAAMHAAQAMADAIRHRRSRRTRADAGAQRLDLRRVLRRSLPTGGEPLKRYFRRRVERPARLLVFCDVSGSMGPYARVFLAFIKAPIGADLRAEAFLVHTRLVRITDALRDGDTLRAVDRLNLLAEGFGGGTKLGSNLKAFNAGYAGRIVSGRTVVVILSDGYDTDPPEVIGAELGLLKRRGCRIVWLNPCKGWRDYEPVARAMAVALPHLDLFAAANTLDALAALEPEFARL